MKVPEEKIQEIREATDMIEVVSQYVTLKKRGKSFVGLCPFHTEKTPSFNVDPVRGFYHCFGCGAGGSVFNFVMQMEGVSFPEALRTLADKAGVPLPQYRPDDESEKESEALYNTNAFAAKYFQHQLNKTPQGQKALGYFLNRQFTEESVSLFHIGYAPDSWDGLLKSAAKQRIKTDVLHKAGLIVARKDNSGFYDRFRGRLMFPIANPSGRIVGFGGRALKKEERGPKYLNSPETRIYQKSRLLYGLYQSKAGIRRLDQAILVEGYTDLIRLHQSGLDNVVATSGTALTEDQARLILRYTKKIVLVFDGDSAGLSAALRGLDVLISAGLNVQIVPLPEGADPDSFTREKGRDAIEKLVSNATSIIDFQLARMRQAGKLKTPGDRAAAARTILATVSKMPDPLERNMTIKDLSEKLDVEESILTQQIKQKQSPGTEPPQTESILSGARQKAEEGLLRLLLEDSLKFGRIIFKLLQKDHFHHPDTRTVIDVIHEFFSTNRSLTHSVLMDHFSDNLALSRFLIKIASEPIEYNVDRTQLGTDCTLIILQEDFHKKISEVQAQMKSSKNTDALDLQKRYLTLKQDLDKMQNNVISTWKKNVEIL